MSIPLTGTSSLFVRLGREIALVNEYSDQMQTDFTTNTDTVYAQYQSAQRDVVNGLTDIIASLRSAESSFNASIIDIGQQTLQIMAADDTGADSYTLQEALLVLKDQMTLGGWYISQPTITAAADSLTTTNSGSGAQAISAKTPNGLPLMSALAETMDAVCTSDYYLNGGGSQGTETFSLISTPSVDFPQYNWPQGSGTNTTINAVFGPKSSLAGDSSFESWTSNTPNNWTVVSGTPGTTILKANTTAAQNTFGGLYCLEFVQSANGSEIQQTLSTSTAGATYAIGGFIKRNSGTTGTLYVGLRNASLSSGYLTMDNGWPAYATFTINGSYTVDTWTLFNTFLYSPTVSPADGIAIVIGFTASGASTVDLDDVCITQPQPIYTGGPTYQIYSGYTPFVKGDRFRWTVSADNNNTTFSRSLNRFWATDANNVRLPSTTGTANVANSLITLS